MMVINTRIYFDGEPPKTPEDAQRMVQAFFEEMKKQEPELASVDATSDVLPEQPEINMVLVLFLVKSCKFITTKSE